MRKTVACAFLAAALCAVGAQAQKAQKYPIEQFKLKNGMRVVLSQDKSAPVVGLALAYDVGSKDEAKGKTGFAHLFEHMMFQGSANVGKFEHAKLIDSAGGVMNGFTRPEDTTYVETVPSEKLPLILWLEADRMRSLAVTSDNLKNQQEVVKEEKRLRYDNLPYANARQKLVELAIQNPSYQHSTIGSMKDLDEASLQDVKGFFKTYYAPNNAVLVLVGDLDIKQTKLLVSKFFDAVPSQPAPPKPNLAEPKQSAERRESVSDPLARLPALMMAWHGPSLAETDSYAVDIMNEILFSGETSRAYQEIIKGKQLAVSLNGGLNQQRGPSLFTLMAIFPANVNSADLEKAIYAQIDALKHSAPSIEELTRVKARLNAARYRSAGFQGVESMLGRAVEIADHTIFQNNPELINTEFDKYLAVTPAQVQAVANKYFAPANRTVLEVQAAAGRPMGGTR